MRRSTIIFGVLMAVFHQTVVFSQITKKSIPTFEEQAISEENLRIEIDDLIQHETKLATELELIRAKLKALRLELGERIRIRATLGGKPIICQAGRVTWYYSSPVGMVEGKFGKDEKIEITGYDNTGKGFYKIYHDLRTYYVQSPDIDDYYDDPKLRDIKDYGIAQTEKAKIEESSKKLDRSNEEKNRLELEQIKKERLEHEARREKAEKLEHELEQQREKDKKEAAEKLRKEKLARVTKLYGPEIATKVIKNQYWIGMTKDIAVESLGKPNNINRSVFSGRVSEQWIYNRYGLYLYFENGILNSYQDTR